MNELRTASSSDRHGYPFEPEVVLPTQFFTGLRSAAHEGERRLLLAVLEDAVHCFRTHLFAQDNRRRRLFREAQEWLMSEDRQYDFSFENICDCLELNAAYIRQGLHRWAHAAASQRQQQCGADTAYSMLRRAAAPTAAVAIRSAARTLADGARADRPPKMNGDQRDSPVDRAHGAIQGRLGTADR
jgi:hypothetical protein